MIKLIIFDLDGVLCSTKEIHFKALNMALGEKFQISKEEHLSKYEGLKTNQKLNILSKEKGLPFDVHQQVWDKKQNFTLKLLENIETSKNVEECLKKLSEDGYKLACCSNSIRKTIFNILSKLKLIQYFDLIISNEDVKRSKPHPEIYWKAMSVLGFLPEECLIVEDSPIGLLAANRSCANIFRIDKPENLTYDNISIAMKSKKIQNCKWVDKKLNVLIPMAGLGSRFEKAGFTFPKPLIDVNGKPMIQIVVENLNIEANYIYIVQKKHREKYNLDSLLSLITPNCKIIEVEGVTEGAACSALLAKEYINNNEPLFFANSDQFIEWDSSEFMYKMQETNSDGGIVTFESTHPKWSFAKVNNEELVVEIAEKNPISNNATVGYYYWKKGSDFVKYAEQMIQKNLRVNGEFYVCPVFNEAIQDNKKIKIFNISKMWGLGDPESLDYYLKNYKET